MTKTKFSLRLTEELYEWLKEEAEKKGISINALISFVLSDYKNEQEF